MPTHEHAMIFRRRPWPVTTAGQEHAELNKLIDGDPAFAKEITQSLLKEGFCPRKPIMPLLDQVNQTRCCLGSRTIECALVNRYELKRNQ